MPRLNAGNDPANWPRPTLQEVDALCQSISSQKGWMGKRDSSAISMAALFGKREGEITMLRARDLDFDLDAEQFRVRFYIEKDHKSPYKICGCGSKNRASWNYCKNCGSPLATLSRIVPSRNYEQAQKIRPLKYPLVRYVEEWWNVISDKELFLFPVNGQFNFLGPSEEPDFSRNLSGDGLYQIVKRNAETWWPHLFRHVLATRFAEAGRGEIDLMDWFDWRRYETARRYIKLGAGRRIVEMGKI